MPTTLTMPPNNLPAAYPLIGADDNEGYEGRDNILLQLFQKLRSLDGLDEAAQSLALAPGIAGPAATTGMLALITPFVYFGFLGMKEEYKEACKEFREILQEQTRTADKLRALATNSDKWRKFLARKLNLDIRPSKQRSLKFPGELNLSTRELEEFAYHISHDQALENKKLVLALGKKYGWTGMMGMGGMFIGMLPTTASTAIDIVKEAGAATSTTLQAASILGMVANGFFIFGQLGMGAYAFNRYLQGKITEKHLFRNRAQFLKYSSTLTPDTCNQVLAHIDKKINFNQWHSIRYGMATIAGQFAMLISTVMSFTPASPFAFVALIIGAPTTIIAAIIRIVYEEKEEKFKGTDTPYAQHRLIDFNLFSLLTADTKEDSHHYVRKKLDQGLTFYDSQLGHTKLYSILRHIINDSKYKPLSNNEKIARLHEILTSERYSFCKRTSLSRNILDQTITLVQHYTANGALTQLLSLDKNQANHILLANTTHCANSTVEAPHQFNLGHTFNQKEIATLFSCLGLKKTEFYAKLKYATLQPKDYPQINEIIIEGLKNSFKFIRGGIIENFIELANIQEVKSCIARENTRYKYKEEELSSHRKPHSSSLKPNFYYPETTLGQACGNGFQPALAAGAA